MIIGHYILPFGFPYFYVELKELLIVLLIKNY